MPATAGKDGEVRLPDPSDARSVTELEGLPVLRLSRLIETKIACGMGNIRRTHKDFADVIELILQNRLNSSFARYLHKSLRKPIGSLSDIPAARSERGARWKGTRLLWSSKKSLPQHSYSSSPLPRSPPRRPKHWTLPPSGRPIRSASRLLTHGKQQLVAFYDQERRMTIASRRLDEDHWQLARLPSTLGWDSHNFVTMAVDSAGQIHVCGNMHCVPLIYFRTTPRWISRASRKSRP